MKTLNAKFNFKKGEVTAFPTDIKMENNKILRTTFSQ